jgi:cullin-associated NEDD8-dissociated protein 1
LQVNSSLVLPSSLYLNPSKALESIVLRMPAEATPFLAVIIQVATRYIKFDPVSTFMRPTIYIMRLIFIKNYAGGGDDEDEEMLDEDEDDDGDLDEYVNCRV